MPSRESAVISFSSISANVSFCDRVELKTRMSASCAAGMIYLLETNIVSASDFCIITEQYFALMGLLMWVAGIVVLLSSNERRSAAQSNFAPNAFMMLLSISIASGPR